MPKIFMNIQIVLASIGLVMATSSLISGLQLVKMKITIEGKIHRFNGYASIVLYVVLAALSFTETGLRFMSVVGWTLGLLLILSKLWIVRKSRKKRRAFKYISWFGGTLILLWLYLVYIHIPL